MLEEYSDNAGNAIKWAKIKSVDRGHSVLLPSHILYGIISAGGSCLDLME